jgi:hypothetical protein
MVMEDILLGIFKLYYVTDYASAFFFGRIKSLMLNIQLANFLDGGSYQKGLRIILTFSVASGVVRLWFVVLAALTASSQLA